MAKCRYHYKYNAGVNWRCILPIGKSCPNTKHLGHKCFVKPKPKSKMVRIKAWADVGGTGECKGKLFGAFPDKGFTDYKPAQVGYKPCTILIDRKYIKGEKK